MSYFISFREIDIAAVCSIQLGDNLCYNLVGAIVSRTKTYQYFKYIISQKVTISDLS